jgi:hypothetical protein
MAYEVFGLGLVTFLAGLYFFVVLFGWPEQLQVGKKKKTIVLIVAAAVFVFTGGLAIVGMETLELPGFSVAGGSNSGMTGACDKTVTVDTLNAIGKDAVSDAYDIAGVIQIFEPDADLTDPTVEPRDSITLSSGKGSSTNKVIQTCTDYRVVYQGDGNSQTDYDKDLGVMQFDISSFNAETSSLTFDIGGTYDIATIEDPLEEDATDGSINGATSNTSIDIATNEIGASGDPSDGDALVYDISQADGSVYLDLKLGATGSNAIIKDMVIVFDWESGAEPEGDEYSAITAQVRQGSLPNLPSDWLPYWSNQGTIAVADIVKSGDSNTVRMTLTVTEANLGADDDWKLTVEDLGGLFEDDVTSGNKGASGASVDLDAKA